MAPGISGPARDAVRAQRRALPSFIEALTHPEEQAPPAKTAPPAPPVMTEERAKKIRSRVGKVGLSWPHVNMITSPFGRRRSGFHHGMDILCAPTGGEYIYAAAPGRVVTAGWLGVYGRAVILDHGRGYRTLYAHMSRLSVRPGQRLDRGNVVGRCGSTGNSTNPHLHFEVYRNGRVVNPRHLLPGWGA